MAALCRVTAVAAGANHSIALTVGGKLMVFGANEHGQLGIGDATDQWRPSRLELSPRSGGQPRCLRAVQIACGQNHTIALFSVEGRLQVRAPVHHTHTHAHMGTAYCSNHSRVSSAFCLFGNRCFAERVFL